ncbi:MAG: hypothetical protein V7704_06200 [Aurantimonas endophytica]
MDDEDLVGRHQRSDDHRPRLAVLAGVVDDEGSAIGDAGLLRPIVRSHAAATSDAGGAFPNALFISRHLFALSKASPAVVSAFSSVAMIVTRDDPMRGIRLTMTANQVWHKTICPSFNGYTPAG